MPPFAKALLPSRQSARRGGAHASGQAPPSPLPRPSPSPPSIPAHREPWMKLRGAARPAWVVQALERGENPYAVEDTRPVVNLLRRHKGRLGEHPDTRRYYRYATSSRGGRNEGHGWASGASSPRPRSLCVALGCAHLEAGRSTRASHELVHALSLDSADTEVGTLRPCPGVAGPHALTLTRAPPTLSQREHAFPCSLPSSTAGSWAC